MKNCSGIPHPAQIAYPISDGTVDINQTDLTDGGLYVDANGSVYEGGGSIGPYMVPPVPYADPDPIKINPQVTPEDIYQQSDVVPPAKLPQEQQPPTYQTGSLMDWIKANPLLSAGAALLIYHLLTSKK